MKKSDIKNSADMFLYKAIVDLNSGKYLLDAYNAEMVDIDIEKIYFELQQSAEKLLKSILSREKIKFPKSHDIERLIELCIENEIELIKDIDSLVELSDYAVEGRYSIIHDDINEADKYIEILDMLIFFLNKNL
ncbi:HEPN domain-containing protein [Sulfurimonas sp.]